MVYIPAGTDQYMTSQIPSLDVVEQPRSVLQLAAVGPGLFNPCLTAVSDDFEFLYSCLSGGNVVDPAAGFADWQVLDLGDPVLKVSSLVVSLM